MIFGYYAENVTKGAELQSWIKSQREIKSARMRIIQDVIYSFIGWKRRSKKGSQALEDLILAFRPPREYDTLGQALLLSYRNSFVILHLV